MQCSNERKKDTGDKDSTEDIDFLLIIPLGLLCLPMKALLCVPEFPKVVVFWRVMAPLSLLRELAH